MNTNNVEELINSIDPNTLQCYRCKKWFTAYNLNHNFIKHYDICQKCCNDKWLIKKKKYKSELIQFQSLSHEH